MQRSYTLIAVVISSICFGCSSGNNSGDSPQSDAGNLVRPEQNLIRAWDLISFSLSDGRTGAPSDSSFSGIVFQNDNRYRVDYSCDGGIVGTFTVDDGILSTLDGEIFGGDVGCDATGQDDVLVQFLFQSTFFNATSMIAVSDESLIVTTITNDVLTFVQSP